MPQDLKIDFSNEKHENEVISMTMSVDLAKLISSVMTNHFMNRGKDEELSKDYCEKQENEWWKARKILDNYNSFMNDDQIIVKTTK